MQSFIFIQEQLESAEREIAMANERERQLHLKIKKLKDDVKAEKEEVGYKCCIRFHMVMEIHGIWNLGSRPGKVMEFSKMCSGHGKVMEFQNFVLISFNSLVDEEL